MKTITIKEIKESHGGEYFVEIKNLYPPGQQEERGHVTRRGLVSFILNRIEPDPVKLEKWSKILAKVPK